MGGPLCPLSRTFSQNILRMFYLFYTADHLRTGLSTALPDQVTVGLDSCVTLTLKCLPPVLCDSQYSDNIVQNANTMVNILTNIYMLNTGHFLTETAHSRLNKAPSLHL